MTRAGMLLSFLATVACATVPQITDHEPMRLNIERTAEGFLLTLSNPSEVSRCLPVENWPNHAGKLHFAAERVRVEIGGRLYPVRDFNIGYCPGGCGLVSISPQSQVTALLPYSEFPNLPLPLPADARLVMPVVETPCDP